MESIRHRFSYVVVATIAVLLAHCSRDRVDLRDQFLLEMRTACGQNEDADYFFAERSLGTPEHADEVREYISDFLRWMGEPSLSCGVKNPAIRVVVIGSLDPKPIAIRANRSARAAEIVVTALPSSAVGGPFLPATKLQRVLSDDEWRDLQNRFQRFDFWMPQSAQLANRMALDDSTLAIEQATASSYQVVLRLGAQVEPDLQKAIDQMFALAPVIK